MGELIRRRYISFGLIALLGGSLAWPAMGASVQWVRAHDLYQRTDYEASLKVLLPEAPTGDPDVFELIGQNYFMRSEERRVGKECRL